MLTDRSSLRPTRSRIGKQQYPVRSVDREGSARARSRLSARADRRRLPPRVADRNLADRRLSGYATKPCKAAAKLADNRIPYMPQQVRGSASPRAAAAPTRRRTMQAYQPTYKRRSGTPAIPSYAIPWERYAAMHAVRASRVLARETCRPCGVSHRGDTRHSCSCRRPQAGVLTFADTRSASSRSRRRRSASCCTATQAATERLPHYRDGDRSRSTSAAVTRARLRAITVVRRTARTAKRSRRRWPHRRRDSRRSARCSPGTWTVAFSAQLGSAAGRSAKRSAQGRSR